MNLFFIILIVLVFIVMTIAKFKIHCAYLESPPNFRVYL